MEGKSNTSGRLQHEELTGQIIGAGIHVHRELGPGFVESIYANALAFARPGTCMDYFSTSPNRPSRSNASSRAHSPALGVSPRCLSWVPGFLRDPVLHDVGVPELPGRCTRA